jgi:hypothetical protein
MKKDTEKFLHYPKKLEEHQTARKAKEIDEVQRFNRQLEYHQHLELHEVLDTERMFTESQKQASDETMTDEQRQVEVTTEELLEVNEFEAEVSAMTMTALESDFPENQESEDISSPASPQQLTAGSPDPFTHELSELTETCLQQELEKNDATLKKAEKETKKNPIRQTLYIR